eukprot:m51a1_g8608 hypothetical protein (704) ;mRNA; f:201113-204238
MSWKEACADLEAVAASLGPLSALLSLRSADSHRICSLIRKTASSLGSAPPAADQYAQPPHAIRLCPGLTGPNRNRAVCSVWSCCAAQQKSQAEAWAELERAAAALQQRLQRGQAAAEAQAKALRQQGVASDEDLKSLGAKSASETDRRAKREAVDAAEKAQKTKPKLREDVAKAEDDVRQSEARSARIKQSQLAVADRQQQLVADLRAAHDGVVAERSAVLAELAAAEGHLSEAMQRGARQLDGDFKAQEPVLSPRRCSTAAASSPRPGAGEGAEEAACETVVRLLDAIVRLEGQRFEGIFRIPESAAAVDRAMEALEASQTLPATPNLAAVVLKRWLTKKLPEPLVPFAQYEAAVVKGEDALAVFQSIQEPRRGALQHLLDFVRYFTTAAVADVTKMNARAILTCLTPCVLRPPPHLESSKISQIAAMNEKEVAFVQRLVASVAAAEFVPRDRIVVTSPGGKPTAIPAPAAVAAAAPLAASAPAAAPAAPHGPSESAGPKSVVGVARPPQPSLQETSPVIGDPEEPAVRDEGADDAPEEAEAATEPADEDEDEEPEEEEDRQESEAAEDGASEAKTPRSSSLSLPPPPPPPPLAARKWSGPVPISADEFSSSDTTYAAESNASKTTTASLCADDEPSAPKSAPLSASFAEEDEGASEEAPASGPPPMLPPRPPATPSQHAQQLTVHRQKPPPPMHSPRGKSQ